MPSYALIAGAGAGTSASVARLFAKHYTVVLLSRNEKSYAPTIQDITAAGGKAIGIIADLAQPDAVSAAFDEIEKQLPGHELAVAVYNPGAGFQMGSFLDMKLEDLDNGLATSTRGLFSFAQHAIPLLLKTVATTPAYPPTLIVTGATASIRGGARFSTFASGKFAQRGLTQSLAREFSPQGVHVAYAIIDGGIKWPDAKWMMNGGTEDGMLLPDSIAESYWHLHTQHRSAFTLEMDLRPYIEKF